MKNYNYDEAMCAALRVEFLETKEELNLYANAIYTAMMWGKKVGK